MTYAGKEQAQIFVDLRRSAHGTTRIAGNHFLLNSDSRRNAAYEIALRLVHTTQELACITAQTLNIASLTFGI